MPRRTHRTGDEARTLRRRKLIARLARELRGAPVDVFGAVAESELFELQARAGERIRLDDVGAGGKVGLVNRADGVGARQDERLVAAVVTGSAEVLGG